MEGMSNFAAQVAIDANGGDAKAVMGWAIGLCADVKNERFRSIDVLRGPRGRIKDRVTVRAAMERETWERLAQAADMRGTSAAEIIRVLVAEWLDEVKA